MVMNIFDTEYTALKNYNTNNVTDTAQHNFNKELRSFDFMFNSNNLSSYDPFKQKSEPQPQSVNSFRNLTTNYNGDFIGSSLIGQNDNKNMLNKTEINSFSDNYSFLNGLSAFDKNSPQQTWSGMDGQWSNGGDTPTTSANSFINNSQSAPIIGTSPVSNNSGLSSSIPSQSRLMSYMNSSTPPLSTPPLSVSPNMCNAPGNISSSIPTNMPVNIENMKIKDFLHRPPSNGSLKSPSLEASSLPRDGFSLDSHNDGFGNNSFAFSPKDGSDSLFTNFLHGSFNSITLNEDRTNSAGSMEEDVNVWDSLDNFSVELSTSASSSKNAWSKPLKFEKSKSTELHEPINNTRISDIEPISRPKAPQALSQQQQIPQQVPAPLKASIGRKVSELDDFDTFTTAAPPAPKPKPAVRNGDFQVVCNKKNKAPKAKPAAPPAGLEKCSYGVRCLFGVECSRWHSPDDHEAFNRQKLPNGARKCPWGVKCFRKVKCINFHTDREMEQFRKEGAQ